MCSSLYNCVSCTGSFVNLAFALVCRDHRQSNRKTQEGDKSSILCDWHPAVGRVLYPRKDLIFLKRNRRSGLIKSTVQQLGLVPEMLSFQPRTACSMLLFFCLGYSSHSPTDCGMSKASSRTERCVLEISFAEFSSSDAVNTYHPSDRF